MSASLWDPEVLARIGHLQLVARQSVERGLSGSHRSRGVGPSVEFADYKEYVHGDALKDLDWRVAARSDRLVVRQHEATARLPTLVVFDASGDLGTGEGAAGRRPDVRGTKFGYAVTLVATLVYFLLRQGEPVGLATLGGEGVRWPLIPPRAGRTHAAQIFGCLAAMKPGGTADLGEGIVEVARRLRRRSMVVLVSDFMEDPETWGPSLATLSARRADVRAVHLYDPKEMALEFRDSRQFWSPEGGRTLPVDPAGAQTAYAEVVGEYVDEVRSYLSANRALHLRVSTHDGLDRALLRILRGQ